MSIRTKKILLFTGLTFLIDWSLVGLYLALGGKTDSAGMALLAVFYMFVPMLAAIMVRKRIFRQPLAGPLGISFKVNRWFFVAWFLPPVIAFVTMGISLLMPGVTFTPDMSGFFNSLSGALTPEQMEQVRQQLAAMPAHPIWFIVIIALIAGTTVNAVAGFGEELGWRGFLVKELSFMGFWKSSALIGLIWGLWHAPLVLLGLNYPHHPQLGILIMTGWTIVMAPVFSYIRLKAKSVIAAAIFHGTINAVPGLAIVLLTGGDELTVGITGLAGFIAFVIVNLSLLIFDRFITRERVSTILSNLPD
jgi:membrane protease YdiL (CAAX protease family)